MSKKITIIMYHYVRPIAKSEYPGIKGLEFEGFRRQLDYLEKNYSIISSEEIIEAVVKKRELPPNACWLTFDDGYKEHFKYVLPELLKRKLSGAFFPPKIAITESKMLDVNSIHHILSCHKSMEKLMFDLNSLCLDHEYLKIKFNHYIKNTVLQIDLMMLIQFLLKECFNMFYLKK